MGSNLYSKILSRAIERASQRPFFVAGDLLTFQSLRHYDDDGLASFLGCAPEALPNLALCRRPDAADSRFHDEVGQIAAHVGADASRLAELFAVVAAAGGRYPQRSLGDSPSSGSGDGDGTASSPDNTTGTPRTNHE